MTRRAWTTSLLTAALLAGAALLPAAETPAPNTPKPTKPVRPSEFDNQPEPVPAAEAAGKMTLPPGFTATLFAGEPDLHQPIGFCFDRRGRVWVAENFSYAQWREKCDDRVVIYEDADGDGKFDKRTVFAQGMFHYITGVQVGMGGVYVMDSPNLYFFPLDESGDKPAGEPQIVLEGWNWKGQHNVPNSMTWGPDGWLYGLNGITVDSNVKVAGAPESERVKVNCGVWRYHPVKKKFERFAEGTTNPWGLDYDARGQLFMSNNVVAHLWHVIQGAHYKRMRGKSFNPFVFDYQIDTIADHLHWGGGDWQKGRGQTVNSVTGGGHSHAGLSLYQGDSFPAEYRNTFFMSNTHGHRVNNDAVARKGSGYTSAHRPDFMMANDKWFRGVTVQTGPEGALYVSDWSDTGECHQYDHPDINHGRLFRIAYQGTKAVKVDLDKESDAALAKMQTLTNEWMVRGARTVLRDRAVAGKLSAEGKAAITELFEKSADPVHKLRGLWTMHQTGLADEAKLIKALDDGDEYVRGWAIQLLCEDTNPSPAALEKFAAMAKADESPVVRLYLAAAMQRTPVEKRWPVLEPLVAREADSSDQNLPQMYWYALEAVIGADPKAAASAVIPKLKIAKHRELAVRRMTAK
ncbi:MAG: PVC-type heme-binding CxxCH protein [Phycisphaerae bacterium]